MRNKVCLIGSTKFQDEYKRVNQLLSKMGYVVYTVACFGHGDDKLTADEKETLDLVHLTKILESDQVVVITNDESYYGDSTRREMKWAKMHGKLVTFSGGVNAQWDIFSRSYPALTKKEGGK